MKFYGPHGNTKTSEREGRKRDVVRCPTCNYEVFRELRTRGMYAGEWKLVDIEGRIHKCSTRKVKQ